MDSGEKYFVEMIEKLRAEHEYTDTEIDLLFALLGQSIEILKEERFDYLTEEIVPALEEITEVISDNL